MAAPTETEEWLDELVARWIDVYKKSMTTLAVLRIIDQLGSANASSIAERFAHHPGWTLTERGLYRTLRRLASDGLLTAQEADAPRTGAKQKIFRLTDTGIVFLNRIQEVAASADPDSPPGERTDMHP